MIISVCRSFQNIWPLILKLNDFITFLSHPLNNSIKKIWRIKICLKWTHINVHQISSLYTIFSRTRKNPSCSYVMNAIFMMYKSFEIVEKSIIYFCVLWVSAVEKVQIINVCDSYKSHFMFQCSIWLEIQLPQKVYFLICGKGLIYQRKVWQYLYSW